MPIFCSVIAGILCFNISQKQCLKIRLILVLLASFSYWSSKARFFVVCAVCFSSLPCSLWTFACNSRSAFFLPHSSPLILANHMAALPWPSWLVMWKNCVFRESLHFEKCFFKKHASEWACAFVQPGQENAALAVLKHSLQLGSQKNSPYAALMRPFLCSQPQNPIQPAMRWRAFGCHRRPWNFDEDAGCMHQAHEIGIKRGASIFWAADGGCGRFLFLFGCLPDRLLCFGLRCLVLCCHVLGCLFFFVDCVCVSSRVCRHSRKHIGD